MKIVIYRYEAILLGSLLLLSGAVIPSSWEPPVPTHFLPPPVVQEPLTHPWIALTFDDGPHPVMTERLLKVLHDEHVPGTFFVVGKMADRYPGLVREIAQQGHELANHTYSHPRLTNLSDADVLSELDETRLVIQRLSGQETMLFRPPGGDYSKRMLKVTTKAGYRMVLWSVLTRDVQGATPYGIYHRIIDHASDGTIVLMHSGIENTVAILPKAIDELRSRGYHFVTMSQLLHLPPYHTLPPTPTPTEVPMVQTASRPPSPDRTAIQ